MASAERPAPAERTPLRKTHDYLYEYRGLWADGARVRIRIFDSLLARPVVIATEPAENPGPSVTNMIEYLAAEMVAQHFRHPLYEERPPIFIEHYPPRRHGNRPQDETFDLVEFARSEPRPERAGSGWRISLGEPTWTRLTQTEIEDLLGHSTEETR